MKTNLFTKGMNSDSHPKYQEEGTVRFALNAVLESINGNSPSISSELGNVSCANGFPATKKIIGATLTENEEIILFLYDPNGQHEIGRFTPSKCEYSSIIVTSCLNFSEKYPINAIYNVANGCDPSVYITDGYNPYRVINLNDIEQYKQGSSFSCPKMNYTRDTFVPCVTLHQGVNSTGILENVGGDLPVGTYYFAVRFLDKYLNPSKWTTFTRPVAIGSDPYNYTQENTTVNMYDGGSNTPESDYYVGKTNKAISLLINGTGGLFEFFQVAVVKRTTDEGAITDVEILNPLPWPTNSASFVYKGTEDQIETSISLDELLSENLSVHKVEAQALDAGVLYVANIKGIYRDYSKYQQYVSKVKTEFVKSPITDDKSSKVRQGVYYFQDGSLMENETYCFGMGFVFANGDKSPIFYTIGRAADVGIPGTGQNPYIGTGGVAADGGPWDTRNAAHGSALFGSPRWKHISTAVQYGTTLAGLPGYYECSTTYPEIETCTELPDGYWGRDWQGNLIQPGVTKIRHHTMPGPEIRDASSAASAWRTGVRFSNIEYPPGEDIVGHFFVYGDRTFERRILAKGAFIPLYKNGSDYTIDPSTISAQSYNVSTPPNTGIKANLFAFISSDLLLKEKVHNGVYAKFEKIYLDRTQEVSDSSITENLVAPFEFSKEDEYTGDLDITTQYRYFTQYNLPDTLNLNHTVRTDLYIPKSYPGQQQGNEGYEFLSDTTFTNNSLNTNYQIVSLNSGSTDIINAGGAWRGKLYFGALMQTRDVFANLYDIKFKEMSNCLSRPGSLTTTFTVYGGDTATSRLSMVDFNYKQTGVPEPEDPSSFKLDVDSYFLSFLTQDTYLNYEFRHGATTDKKRQYYAHRSPNLFSENHKFLRNYIKRKAYKVGDKSFGIYPEEYNYNNSFSFLDGFNYHYPIPFNYQYCNVCLTDKPYSVYASDKLDYESSIDRLRQIRVNNYTDEIGGNTGPITDLFVSFGKLYATTKKSVFTIPTRPQSLQTDVDNIFLGTGALFSIPPVELKTSNQAFAGQEKFTSRVNTEYGAFYMDSLAGYPILLGTNIEDISLQGMRNFFQENGKLEFAKQFNKLTGQQFETLTTTHIAGYKTAYDPRFKRLILHKKDFVITPEFESSFVYFPTDTDLPSAYNVPNALWYNGHSFYYNGTVKEKVFLDNVTFFENKSFTLSYSFITKYWTSFHSYLPSYLFQDSTTYYSQLNFGEIFKHNTLNYQNYYNTKFPHIVDIVFNNPPTQSLLSSSISYSARVTELDPSTTQEKDVKETYSYVTFYNSNQSSGELKIVVPDDFTIDLDNSSVFADITDNEWRINQIWDNTISNNLPIWDSSWSSKATTPFVYIDKNVNAANISFEKPFFDIPRLRDYYLGARMLFNPNKNQKISLDLGSAQTQYTSK